MDKLGFDNQKYLELQSAHIRERIRQFGNKLYLEFGGKLFDDHHASRVLPGFEPDSKIRMLKELRDSVEVVIAICASDIEKNKIRGDLGITYDVDVLRLIDAFRGEGLLVGSVAITQYAGQPAADAFRRRMEHLGVRTYLHYPIAGYPHNTGLIVSDGGYGKNDYIETSRPLVVVTAPGPGSGKMAVCLSQLYHDYKRGIKAGYAKFETFPIWNLPLQHPVNLAYEAATADLGDVNMIDPFHLAAYGETTVNYNRDVEIFPVLSAMFERIMGECPYKSPTDMGVNMAGKCIVDDEAVCAAARQEIVRRYYTALCDRRVGAAGDELVNKLELLMQQAHVDPSIRRRKASAAGCPEYWVTTTLPTYSSMERNASMRRRTSLSYVMPRSPRTLFFSMSAALMAMMTSALSFICASIRILLSGSNPGSTRLAWKSSNSLPPNSRYSLPPNWAIRSRMCWDWSFRYWSLSNPCLAMPSLLILSLQILCKFIPFYFTQPTGHRQGF